MHDFYNGYRFSSQCEERVYNPTLALYFLKHLTRHGGYPVRLLDDNLAVNSSIHNRALQGIGSPKK